MIAISTCGFTICRVASCISSGQSANLDVSVDGGHWYDVKCKTRTTTSSIPILPISGWKKFPSTNIIPSNFNDGHMYHYIIESVQDVGVDIIYDCGSDDEETKNNRFAHS